MSEPGTKFGMQQVRSQPLADGFSRRSFLAGSVGGSLVLAFAGPELVSSARAALQQRRFTPSVWFELDAEGGLSVNIAKAEMGQHVGTALARIVADELGADWDRVRLAHVDTDPKWGYMVTGGSWSVFTSFTMLSQAAAAGRMVLIEAGAKLLGVDPASCKTLGGQVSSGAKSISFGEIVQRGEIERQFSEDELKAMPVKAAAERQLIGRPTRALDIPDKTRGAAKYGIDAERPGMVYGRPVLPPTRFGCSILSVDDSAARGIPGYLGYRQLDDPSGTLQGWAIALADNYWSAHKAAQALSVQWQPGPNAHVSEADLFTEGERLARVDAGPMLVNAGNVDEALGSAERRLEAVYRTGTALHFPLEPGNALAEEIDGTWHIHTGNQWQSLILPVVAKALGVEESRVVLHTHYLGGGFGRRLWGDYILPAALAAKALGKPVKVILSREDDSRLDCVRSPSVQYFEAALGAQGETTGVRHSAVAGWPTLTMAPGFMGEGLEGSGKFDPFSANGADHWYSFAHHRVRAVNNPLAQATFLPGYLRSVAPGWIAWGVESFMDELAQAAGQDPIEFRLARLDGAGANAGSAPNSVGGAHRLAQVLREVRAISEWDRTLPKDEALGVATSFGQERNMPTWTACVAHVRVNRNSGQVRVLKLWQVIDCGTVVHPDGAMAQAEGASLWGLSLALHEGTRFAQGQVVDRNLVGYTPLRMNDVPELDIRFVESSEFPTGLGEPPLIAVAPAIGNAIFRAVGVRLRDLPIRAAAVKAALAG